MPRFTAFVPLVVAILAAGCGAVRVTPTSSTPPPSADGVRTPDPAPSASMSGSLGLEGRCENEALGYVVGHPNDWWVNEEIAADAALTPVPACQYFAPTAVDLQPNAGLPAGLAIWFELRDVAPRADGEVRRSDEVTVDGRNAVVVEFEPTPQAGFVPEGAVVRQYHVELADGTFLVATTDTIHQDASAFRDSAVILDHMMETIEIEER
jgi:hypothetical protein